MSDNIDFSFDETVEETRITVTFDGDSDVTKGDVRDAVERLTDDKDDDSDDSDELRRFDRGHEH